MKQDDIVQSLGFSPSWAYTETLSDKNREDFQKLLEILLKDRSCGDQGTFNHILPEENDITFISQEQCSSQ